MRTEETRLLHAYLDGELDPAKAIELEGQMARNPQLRSAYERLREMSGAIREKADYHATPPALAARLARSRVAQPRGALWHAWLRPAAALAVAVVLGAGLGYFVMKPGEEDLLAREAVAGHVRATLAGQLIQVASSDQHTVKPWLSAHLPFSPPVADFAKEGFPLTGARIEYLGGKPVAVLVYRRRLHAIDLYVAPGSATAAEGPFLKDGFSVVRFSQDGMRFWAVSDVEGRELEHFARLVAAGG